MIKKFPKILTKAFLSILVFQMLFLACFFLAPEQVLSAEKMQFIPQVGIGEDFKAGGEKEVTATLIGEYIAAIYKYAIGIVGILATVIMMYGGIRWLTSGGSQEKIGEAKSWIVAALSGLLLTMASFLILTTINPDLVEIKPIVPEEIGKAPEIGCCEYTENDMTKAQSMTENSCGEKEGTFNKEHIALGNKCIKEDKGGCCLPPGNAVVTCKYVNSEKECKGDYFNNTTCNLVDGCRQHGSVCDGTSNTEYKQSCTRWDGATGICYNNLCRQCNNLGDLCGAFGVACCAGMCCESKGLAFDRCVRGLPTNEKYCN